MMRISPRTQMILSNFCQINPSLTIYPGNVIRTSTPSTFDTYARARVDETFEKEISIYNLKAFLAVLSLFDDPDVTIQGPYAVITGGGSECKFTMGNSSLFKMKNQDPNLPEHDAVFKLTAATLKSIHKASSVLSLDTLTISVVGGKVKLTTNDPKNSSKNVFSVGDIDALGKDVRCLLRMSTLSNAIINDYEVKVKDTYVQMTSKDGVSYLFPAKAED
jgi:hypothetical protein